MLRAEHHTLDVDIHDLSAKVYELRDQSAKADGVLAGLEEQLGRHRSRRQGEEYGLDRYLGSSLFRWELLRTKVAHHLAVTFTQAREEIIGQSVAIGWEEAEKNLDTVEEQLQHAATTHKQLAERRTSLGKKLRAFLKSLLLSCDADAGEVPLDAAISKRFHVLTNKQLGVAVQAAEELTRFLNMTFVHTLPQTFSFLERLLAPYSAFSGGPLLLPQTWKPKPKIGRWWEWLGGVGNQAKSGTPLKQKEFERRFAAAKRRFSVRVSAAEPIVMVYILWLLLDEIFGTVVPGEGPKEVLALPSPTDVRPTEMFGVTHSTVV